MDASHGVGWKCTSITNATLEGAAPVSNGRGCRAGDRFDGSDRENHHAASEEKGKAPHRDRQPTRLSRIIRTGRRNTASFRQKSGAVNYTASKLLFHS